MLSLKVVSSSLGLSFAITFAACVVYGLIVPPTMHAAPLLEALLPGFTWLTPEGFLIGLVESFLYGVFAGLVFVPIYNLLARRLV